MKNYTIITCIIMTAFLPGYASAQKQSGSKKNTDFVTVSGKEVLTPDGDNLLLRGIGLGNWLLPEGYMWKFDKATSPRQINQVISELIGPASARSFWKEYRQNYITRKDILYLKKIGMNSVRVAIDYRILTPEDQPGIWLKSGFHFLDQLVQWCRQEGIYVILDMHAAPGGQTGENIDNGWGYPFLFRSPESQRRLIKIWKKLARRYKDEPAVLGYDLLNEPIPTFEGYDILNKYLVPLYKRITKAIRKIDSNHIVIIEGAQWAGNFDVFGDPFDDNMIYSFHKYWMPPEQEQIQPYIEFGNKYNVPIWLGESGENKNEWIETFKNLLEKNDIGWSFWPYKKLDSKSCIVSASIPDDWDRIVAFEDEWGEDFKTLRKNRPSIKESRHILKKLLQNIQFDQCQSNAGYIRALGLVP